MSVPQILRNFFKYSPLPFASLGQHFGTTKFRLRLLELNFYFHRAMGLKLGWGGSWPPKPLGPERFTSPTISLRNSSCTHYIFSRRYFSANSPANAQSRGKNNRMSPYATSLSHVQPPYHIQKSGEGRLQQSLLLLGDPYQFPFSYYWEKGSEITKNSATRYLPICLT